MSGMYQRPRAGFRDNDQLREYYEAKYRDGGYGDGIRISGVSVSRLYHEARQNAALAFLNVTRGDRILDAGCGAGTLAAMIAENCDEVCAIDIAANSLDPKYRALPSLRFQQMNAESLQFPSAHFDKIVSVETLEHVLQPRRMLREFYRVLKPGGIVVLTYPTINRTVMKRLHLGRRLSISEHLTEWSYSELLREVTAAGFRFEASRGIAFDLGPLLYLKALGRLWSEGLTRFALGIGGFPRNSLFVVALLRKSE